MIFDLAYIIGSFITQYGILINFIDIESSFKSLSKIVESRTSSTFDVSTAAQKKSHVKFDPNDIIADPGFRKPIKDYGAGIRNQGKRYYLLMGHINQLP